GAPGPPRAGGLARAQLPPVAGAAAARRSRRQDRGRGEPHPSLRGHDGPVRRAEPPRGAARETERGGSGKQAGRAGGAPEDGGSGDRRHAVSGRAGREGRKAERATGRLAWCRGRWSGRGGAGRRPAPPARPPPPPPPPGAPRPPPPAAARASAPPGRPPRARPVPRGPPPPQGESPP